MDKDKQILHHIRINPFISQQELANKVGLSRPAVANYIAKLTKNGTIRGRAYVLNETSVIVCIGGANTDRKARTASQVRLHTSNPVKTTETCGGVARNFAGNLSLLGCSTALFACIGDDKEGMWLLEETRNQGVDVSQVWVFSQERTGTFTTLLDTDGENVIAMADMHIYENLTIAMIAERWPAIAAAKAVFLDTNLPADCVRYIMSRCYDEEIPMYIDPVSAAKARNLPERLDGVDLLILTREEAEVLADKQISSIDDCNTACSYIRGLGVLQLVLMLDDGGVYYFSDKEDGHLLPIKTVGIDVTGTNDALAACVIYGLMNGETLRRACQLGLAGAALTLETDESIAGSLKPDEIYRIAGKCFGF